MLFFERILNKINTFNRVSSAPLPFELPHATNPIITPTYEGSGQVVHPDILIFKSGFRGKKYILCIAPYPYGNDQMENPSVLVSNKKDYFQQTLEDEIIPNPISGLPSPGWFHSDSDMVFWKNTFWLYWRAGHRKGYYRELTLAKSDDLIHWSAKKMVMSYSGRNNRYCSPAFVTEKDKLSVFICNASDKTLHLFESFGGETLSYEQPCNFKLPLKNKLWHIDVTKLTNGDYWALACDTMGNLWFAKSADRINWSEFSIVMQTEQNSWSKHKIYRSTFAVYNGKIMVWYSACSKKTEWHCGYTEASISWLDNSIRSSNVIGD